MLMNMTTLNKPVAGLLTAIFLASALTGCGESDFDIARKPDLVDRAVATAMAKCDTQDSRPQQIPYESRLRQALAEADSATLDRLHDEGVTVCLDQRLKEGDYGFWDKEIKGIYYPSEKVMSLWDNGRYPQDQSWYETKVTTRSGISLDRFASEVISEKGMNDMQIGATYSCGKGCITWHWKNAGKFTDELAQNPDFMKAPVAPQAQPVSRYQTAAL
ncbi:MAG: hypothetical protein ACK4NR_11110 [Micavibrio sp.]